ncbi:hypothetical protein [Pseudomonas palmensis]|uniref:hypothetical protein n=1 Tax=Pseudomonas palmensis TaxID=2815362 RepID=UPI003CEA2FA8
MKIQNGAFALMGSACSEKAIVMFFVTYPKQPYPLLGPFLKSLGVELGRLSSRSRGAVVEAHPVKSLDELPRICAELHGRTLRALIARQEVAND